MASERDNLERLEVRFRAAPAQRSRAGMPGGWWIWCVLGIALGIGGWELGRSHLAEGYKSQLGSQQPAAEALLAIEGLETLGEGATLEVVEGLSHPDRRVARAAYHALERELTRWQQLGSTKAAGHMRDLVTRLQALPQDASVDGLILASSLASRVYAFCLEHDEEGMRAVIQACESIVKTSGQAAGRAREGETRFAKDAQFESSDEVSDELNLLQDAIDDSPQASEMNQSDSGSTAGGAEFHLASGPLRAARQTQSSLAATPHADGLDYYATQSRENPGRISVGNAAVGYAHSLTLPETEVVEQHHEPNASENQTGTLRLSHESRIPTIYETSEVVRSSSLQGTEGGETGEVSERFAERGFQELVSMLGSYDPGVAQQAAYALKVKGLSDERIVLASQLATGSAAERVERVQQIASDGSLDPRPWLLWMAREGEPEVRKLSVSLLSSMLDRDVERELRIMLRAENDREVQQAIRQTLVSGRR
jgi:hypothetical protein